LTVTTTRGVVVPVVMDVSLAGGAATVVDGPGSTTAKA
jgi:hypothetical protein